VQIVNVLHIIKHRAGTYTGHALISGLKCIGMIIADSY